MPGPLTGMTVIEVSAFIAAPYAGLTLAQMGAEVIRIDPIGGGLDYNRWPVTDDGTSLYWAGLNKGKKSVTLNVRDPKGRELAHALMTAAGPGNGIVVTNLPARGWLDYEGLKAMRDDLIMVNIVGRRDGSVALDYTVNARAGFPLVTGPVGTEGPVNHVMPVWDVVTALAASNAVLVADRHRRDTGEGQYVRIALADSAFAVLSHLGYVAEAQINGTDRPATGNHVFGTFGCDFLTSDGRRVMITAFTPRHWSALVEATGLEERFAALAAEKGVDLAKKRSAMPSGRRLKRNWHLGSPRALWMRLARRSTRSAPAGDLIKPSAKRWRKTRTSPRKIRCSRKSTNPGLAATWPPALSSTSPASPATRSPQRRPSATTRKVC